MKKSLHLLSTQNQPQQQQPPEIAQLQAQVQQLLTQVQNQSNTVANLQRQQAASAPARFAVTPAAPATGFLDFDKKGDTVLFEEATKSLYQVLCRKEM